MRRSYSFIVLLTSLLFVTISLSALNTQVPLWLAHEQFPVWQIGVVGSSYFTGNLLGTLIANRLICRWNAKKTYSYICILFALSTLGLSFSVDFYSWVFWRFLIGIACAVTWVVVESCILISGNNHSRSRMLAIYMTTYYLGTVFGQALLRYFPEDVLYFALVIAVLMALAIFSVAFTHYRLPHKKKSFNLMPMIFNQKARIGLVGCVVSGMIIGSLYSLLPVYYAHLNYNDVQVANYMILVILSGMLAQLPIGWLADKYGRSMILLVETVLVVTSCIMLVYEILPVFAIILLGITIYTVYPISMASACETIRKQDIVSMNQAILLVNTLGSLIAPAIISILMDRLGIVYLFISFVVIAASFVILLVINQICGKRGIHA